MSIKESGGNIDEHAVTNSTLSIQVLENGEQTSEREGEGLGTDLDGPKKWALLQNGAYQVAQLARGTGNTIMTGDEHVGSVYGHTPILRNQPPRHFKELFSPPIIQNAHSQECLDSLADTKTTIHLRK